MTPRQAVLGLLVAAAVWGASFSVIKTALGHASPLVLLACRFLIASAPLLPLARGLTRRELGAGLLLGLLFWGGFVFQTTGLVHTTPSRSAFITGLSAPLTPVVFVLVRGTLPARRVLAGILAAAVGTFLLIRPEGDAPLNRGDLLTLGCALLFAGQIVAAGHFARSCRPDRLLLLQLALTGGLSLAVAPLLEAPRLAPTPFFWALLLFLAVSATATFYVQLRGQQVVSPSHTALLFTAEPLFAALTAYALLGERLTPWQWAGGALILAAMLLPSVGPGEPPPPGGGAARDPDGLLRTSGV